ncbi:MAG: hypothetical protein Q7S16_04125 [bacterium]|nr:hypothetical protein [bacterium]
MSQHILSKDQKELIKKKREEILEELRAYFIDAEHHMTTEEIVEKVFNDTDEEFEDYVLLLAAGNPDMEIAQELAMELFNYFPRTSLDGKSYAETLQFDELKKMETVFQNFKNGITTNN